MNIEMALKSGSYILDLDHAKLSLGIFFFLSCLIKSIFHQHSGSNFIFVKNTHQQAANLMYFLISPVAKTPAWFLEGQCNWLTDWWFVEISSKHCQSQTRRAGELKFWENVHLLLCFMCHMSYVKCHLSRVTCHLSCVTCHKSLFFSSFFLNLTKWWS